MSSFCFLDVTCIRESSRETELFSVLPLLLKLAWFVVSLNCGANAKCGAKCGANAVAPNVWRADVFMIVLFSGTYWVDVVPVVVLDLYACVLWSVFAPAISFAI